MIGENLHDKSELFQISIDWDDPNILDNFDSSWKRTKEKIEEQLNKSEPLEIQVAINKAKVEDFLNQSKQLGRKIYHKGERLRLRRLAEDIAESLRRMGAGIYNPDLAQPDPLGQIPDSCYLHDLTSFSPHFTNRTAEQAQLMQVWREKSAPIIQIVAPGGVGKSLLVRHWLQNLVPELEKQKLEIFCWSFISQGFEEQSSDDFCRASIDMFFNKACEFFAVTLAKKYQNNTQTKAEKLLNKLVSRQNPFVLLLDGFEAVLLQNHGKPGEIDNLFMRDFLSGLAELKNRRGICVITTRRNVACLEKYPEIEIIKMPCLTPTDSVELLQRLGVISSEPDGSDLAEASAFLEHHPLSLTVLAACLIRKYGGQGKYWEEAIPEDSADFEELKNVPNGQRLKRMLKSYQKALTNNPEGEAEMQLLGLLGLFKGPVYMDDLKSILQNPEICGYTDQLSPANLVQTIASLQDQELLNDSEEFSEAVGTESDGESRLRLSAHPLIREYFSNQLKSNNPEGWQAIHERIYHLLLLRSSVPPDTLTETMPLYEAVYHGCEAGKCKEAYENVYKGRLHHIHGKFHYAWTRLGAYSSDLVALSSFFSKDTENPWSQVRTEFRGQSDEAELHFAVGICLRALGRLDEAAVPLRESAKLFDGKDNSAAAYAASAYCELAWTLGNLQEAKEWAERGLKYAETTQVTNAKLPYSLLRDMRRSKLARIAEAHFQLGDFEQALVCFKEAEALQQESANDQDDKREQGRIFLYTVSGYYFHNYLLYIGEALAGGWASFKALNISWESLDDIDYRVPAKHHHKKTNREKNEQALADDMNKGVELINRTVLRLHDTVEWAVERRRLLDIGQQYLIRGRALMLQVAFSENRRDQYRQASMDISQAMFKLEEAGQKQEIPQAYLVRAQLRRRLGNYQGAERDLQETERLAKRNGLKALICDIYFEKAWLALDQGQCELAGIYRDKAKTLAEAMDYKCRNMELRALEKRIDTLDKNNLLT